MARPKALKAQDVDDSSLDLLERIKAAVGEILPDQQDYDPVVQLAVFAAQYNPKAEFPEEPAIVKMRIEAAKEVAKYLHPQKRSQEVLGKGGGPIQIKLIDYTRE